VQEASVPAVQSESSNDDPEDMLSMRENAGFTARGTVNEHMRAAKDVLAGKKK